MEKEFELISAAEAQQLVDEKRAERDLLRGTREKEVLSKINRIIQAAAINGDSSYVFLNSSDVLTGVTHPITQLDKISFETLWVSQTIEDILKQSGYTVYKEAERCPNGDRRYIISWAK